MEVILFIVCIALGVTLGKKSSKLNETEKKLEEKERILGEYRLQNKALQEALRVERRKNSPEVAEDNVVNEAVAVNETGEFCSTDIKQPSEEKIGNLVSIVADQQVNEDSRRNMAQVTDAPIATPEMSTPVIPTSRPVVKKEKKARKPISSGVMLFGIGILLVLTAGAIFATTSWKILPAAGKVAVLLGTVAVFYTSSFIAEKKLQLRNTSITFFILGSTFFAVSNLAAGYFGMYGFYEDQKLIIWAVSFLLVALCMIIGRVLYKTRFFALLGYCFLLVSTYLFASYFSSNAVEIAIIMGVMFLATKAYTTFVEPRFEDDLIGKCLKPFQYIYNIAVLIIACTYENGIWSGDSAPLSLKITLGILVVINLGFSLWNAYDKEQISNHSVVFSCLSMLAVGLADRNLEYYSARLFISLILLVAVEIGLRFARNKSFYREQIRCIVSGFAEGVLFLVALGFFGDKELSESIICIVSLIVIAAIQYIIQHFSEDNSSACLSAVSFYLGVVFLGVYAGLEDKVTATVIIYSVLTIAAAFAGRFIYGKIYKKSENGGNLIDWITICAPVLLVLCVSASGQNDSDAGMFFTALVFSGYLATYYGRCSEIVNNVFMTLAISCALYVVGEQPFFDIPKEFKAEWWIAINLTGTALISIVWRKYKKIYIYVWMVAVATAFIGEFFSIQDYSYRDENIIGTLKLVIYLAGVIALFVMSYVKNSKRFLIETGFAFALFSVLAWSFEAKGIFILAAVFGLAYLVYLHLKDMSVWAFLPLIQLYIVLASLDMPNVAWLLIFVVEIVAAYLLHRMWDNEAKKSFADDWINIFAIIPVIALVSTGEKSWIFVAEMMFAIYVLSFYRRYFEDREAIVNKVILTVASAIVLLAWMTQPWFTLPELISDEWMIVGIMGMCIFNMAYVYKHSTNEGWGWITFAAAIISILIQAQEAVSKGNVVDALILGVAMMLLLIWAYITKKKQWFILAGVTLIAQCIYASREFWMSLAWWVYLLVAGALLITIAARSEYKKHQEVDTDEPERRHLFQDWTL